MADIACIFHWSPAAMEAMSLEDLGQWHEKAIARLKLLKGLKD